jgi:hypothetical protein
VRSFDGQRSDSKPVRRTLDEKRRLLVQLKDELQRLKPTAAPAIREGMRGRIAELQDDIARAEQARSQPREPRSSVRSSNS